MKYAFESTKRRLSGSAAPQVILINQPAAKVAFQAVAANGRLQSAFERRKNEFLTGWLSRGRCCHSEALSIFH
jgi:hypothetical protein